MISNFGCLFGMYACFAFSLVGIVMMVSVYGRHFDEGKADACFMSGVVLFLICGGFGIAFLGKSIITSVSSGTSYERPEAIIKTNFITTVVYHDFMERYIDAKTYAAPNEQIFVKVFNGTNTWGRALETGYTTVITNFDTEAK